MLPSGSHTRTRLVRVSGALTRRVDIVESHNSHAAYPILFAKHTGDRNLISSTHLCVVHPRLNDCLQFAMKAWSEMATVACSTMEMRGFRDVSLQEDRNRWLLRKRERRLFDAKSMVLPLGDVEKRTDRDYWASIGEFKW